MLSSRSATISFDLMIRVDDYVVMDSWNIYLCVRKWCITKKGKGGDEWILHSARSTLCFCVAD